MANKVGKVGIPGAAVLFGTAGLYLAYVGVTDVPFFDGLRSILKKERPTSRSTGMPYQPSAANTVGAAVFSAGGALAQQASGDLGLVGNAAKALPTLRKNFPGMTMHGRGNRPQFSDSDHPKGLAIDIMTTDDVVAQRIISMFKGMTGAKYWMWNRKQGTRALLWLVRPINSYSPHTDHVHLSFL